MSSQLAGRRLVGYDNNTEISACDVYGVSSGADLRWLSSTKYTICFPKGSNAL